MMMMMMTYARLQDVGISIINFWPYIAIFKA